MFAEFSAILKSYPHFVNFTRRRIGCILFLWGKAWKLGNNLKNGKRKAGEIENAAFVVALKKRASLFKKMKKLILPVVITIMSVAVFVAKYENTSAQAVAAEEIFFDDAASSTATLAEIAALAYVEPQPKSDFEVLGEYAEKIAQKDFLISKYAQLLDRARNSCE